MRRVMFDHTPRPGAILRHLLLSLPALAVLEGSRLAWNAELSWLGVLGCWGFIVAVLLVARVGRPGRDAGQRWVWPWSTAATVVLGVGAAVISLTFRSTLAAWVWLGAWLALLLQLDTAFSKIASRPIRWAAYLLLALYAGALPGVSGQLQGRFSDEEFFVAVQAGIVSLFWLLLRLPFRASARRQANSSSSPKGLTVNLRSIVVCLVLAGGALGIMALRGYQRSFYAQSASLYDQITPDTPFLCGESAPAITAESGAVVFSRLLEAVAANPRKGAPEYGMLALGTGEEHWAQAFRESLLQEAAAQKFSQAAQSVKYIQREAALRAYYVPRVRQAFPQLFTDTDLRTLADWFGAINQRALTVEWVDWMYAAALSSWPLGPYENQENGAGLLSVLISGGLEDPELADANRAYLQQNPRGWLTRFRNTDDAFIYQPEWLTNALFQAGYTGQLADRNRELAFEWLLLQALPDGRAPQYNHTGQTSLAGIAYLAAVELADPRYLWLADQALKAAAAQGRAVFAQPGAERPTDLMGESPDVGSCLLYGDSGLPTQVGPLAPDKIVFRDGWAPDAPYLLLNLRFSGWHRYKATNTVTLFSVQGPIIGDLLERKTFRWLPTGRSLLRDKRIPRELLSGLLISERGIRAVLYGLTGIGSQWAQDPPWHADVLAFESGGTLDWSHSRIADWQGWQHDRYVYFYHDRGPIIVADRASGPPNSQSALVWHLLPEDDTVRGETWRMRVRTGEETVEFVFVPIVADGQASGSLSFAPEGDHRLSAVFTPAAAGNLQTATLFLMDEWVGADVRVTDPTTQPVLWLTQKNGAELKLPLYR